jgi:hypothetical protein
MKPGARRKKGRGGLELIEEAIHLLRVNAGPALAAYYIGSLPFMLALLYFWADMSRSPFAAQHLTGAALGMALLFLWLKFWQAVFVDGLRARISTAPPTRWNFRRAGRVLLIQTAIQPSALVFLPLSLLPVGLLFPWVYAFYQNVTALTDGETAGIRKTFQRAWRQMLLWPEQNHVILIILGAFGFCVLLNLVTVCLFLPQLLKMFLGIESVYTQSPASMLNSTFVAAMFGLTYLCVDPIVKTVYLLRCFYGESLQTGEDLKAELRQFTFSARAAVVGLILVLSLTVASRLAGASVSPTSQAGTAQPATTPAPGISAPDLDKTINKVIHEARYTWRMPREKVVEEDSEDNVLVRFIKSVLKTVGNWLRDAFKWVVDLLVKWLRHLPIHHGSGGSGTGWMASLQVLLFVLLAAVICALAILLLRAWQNRRIEQATVSSEPIAPVPDLADENVGAHQLPEDGWIKLGRELLARGELRLALRAFYFASLAQLAARNLLTIAKFKSNRDYERELDRRGHALPDLLPLFHENVSVFDRSWYGLHEVNTEMVSQFLANVERIKSA